MSIQLRRARPLLGTLVEVHVDAADECTARRAVEAAFAEVEAVHRCMSFHEPGSDLSRLHATPVGEAAALDARTVEVLRCALELAELSDGCFDPGIAGTLVLHGFLPRPYSPFTPDSAAGWRDVELVDEHQVRLHRPLWLDLGGIAKGYAVDRAIDRSRACGAEAVLVNAGGDLRVSGEVEKVVHLRGADNMSVVGAVAIRDAAVATSVGAATRRRHSASWVGSHFDGRDRRAVGLFSSASVIAPSCMIADALTKIAFAAPPAQTRCLLARYHAQMAFHEEEQGWRFADAAA